MVIANRHATIRNSLSADAWYETADKHALRNEKRHKIQSWILCRFCGKSAWNGNAGI